MEPVVHTKYQLEALVCEFIKNKKLRNKDKILIYDRLCDEIAKNSIPDKYYCVYNNGYTYDFILNLEPVSVDALFDILCIADFK